MRKRKLVFTMMAFSCCAIPMTGCGNNDTASSKIRQEETKTEKKEKGDFIIGEYNEGELTGLTKAGKTKKELVIPKSVKSMDGGIIGDWEGSYQSDLDCPEPLFEYKGVGKCKKITFESDDNVKLKTVNFGNNDTLEEIELPKNLDRIADSLFLRASCLKDITIPAKVEEIESDAFNSCYRLKKVHFAGNNVKIIGGDAFYKCVSLEEIDLPEGLEVIGEDAFKHCYALKKIYIPSTVTEIQDGAFARTYNEEPTEVYFDDVQNLNYDEIARNRPFSSLCSVKIYVIKGSEMDKHFDEMFDDEYTKAYWEGK